MRGTSTFQVRGRPAPRAVEQYLALLRARRSLQDAQKLARRPEVRAQAANAIAKIDAVIDRLEGRSSAKPITPALLALERDVVALRHRKPPVRRKR